jgi:hypothetical protein
MRANVRENPSVHGVRVFSLQGIRVRNIAHLLGITVPTTNTGVSAANAVGGLPGETNSTLCFYYAVYCELVHKFFIT